MNRLPSKTFDRQWLILCEGFSDKKLLDRLIQERNIEPSQFHVQFPSKDEGGTGGRSKFGAYLAAMYEAPTFRANVQAVLVISDNDDDPRASWREVTDQIDASGGFGVPAVEQTVARATGFPDIVVLMVPIGRPGNMETLCVEAFCSNWRSLEKPLGVYLNASPAKGWGISKQSKMKVQTILASTCETRPDTSLGQHWSEPKKYHLSVQNPVFNDLVTFLMNFESLLADASAGQSS